MIAIVGSILDENLLFGILPTGNITEAVTTEYREALIIKGASTKNKKKGKSSPARVWKVRV